MTRAHSNTRRTALLGLLALGGCTVLPDRPFVPTRRHALSPQRPPEMARARSTGQVLLLRAVRAAPGQEVRGLRRIRPNGTLDIAFYEEWLAPPAELAEAALRQWLIAGSGFSAVAAPGTRLATPLILEAELTALEALPEAQIARAGVAALLLREGAGLSEAQVVAQRSFTATAPLARSTPEEAGLAQADGMTAALANVFTELERWLVSSVPQTRRR
jgi:cholesterol transport system auxiliary component